MYSEEVTQLKTINNMGDLRPLLAAVVIALVIGVFGGYFIGKKYGGGWGTFAVFGITALVVVLFATCKPCQRQMTNILFPKQIPNTNPQVQ